MRIQFRKKVPINVTTVELGYRDLALCDISDIALNKLWCQLVSYRHVFFCHA
jgi:hypothetical protein